MRVIFLVVPLVAFAPLHASAQAPSAQTAARDASTSSADWRGRPVRGQDGKVLGQVERVTSGPDGRPAQVLVRPKGMAAGGPRSLAYGSLTARGGSLHAPLSKAEFDAMPAIAPSSK